jgi:phospholipid transport system substrate-binding protein
MHLQLSRRRFLALSVAAVAFLAVPRIGFADDPASARIQAFYDVLVDTMKQGPQLGVQGRFDKMLPAVHAAYDMPAMMKIICGASWDKLPADKQQALVDGFERFSTAIYADRFKKFSGQKFVVDPTPVPRNADVVVKTQLIPADGDSHELNYLMRGPAGNMKIVDVFLDGSISELATRRSDFSGILRNDGPDALIAKLKEKADAILKAS